MQDIDVPIITDFDAIRDIVTLDVAAPHNPKREARVLLDALEIIDKDGSAQILWRGETILIVDGLADPIVAIQPDVARPIFFDRLGKRIDRSLVDVVLILNALPQTRVKSAVAMT